MPCLRDHGLREPEDLRPVALVEAHRDVPRDLDVLALVVAHRHVIGVVQQDVRSLQRRVAGSNDAAGDTLDADEIRFNDWRLNRVTRQLTDPAGMLIPLSNAEFRLLWVFIERPRRLLTRDQLLDAARGRAAEAFDRSIDLLVSRLRQKLNDDPKAPRLLKTVRGEGYMFDARVSK